MEYFKWCYRLSSGLSILGLRVSGLWVLPLWVLALWVLLLWVLVFSSTVLASGSITIAVASNFKPVLSELATEFTQQTGIRVRISAASTGILYNQIRRGAPFDVFLSADRQRPQQLEQQGLGLLNTRRTYAIGQLVLLSNDADLPANEQLFRHWQGRIAMANPRTAPYGRAAMQALQHIDRWSWLMKHREKLIQGNNIAQTFQFVHSGQIKVALVAYSQVKQRQFAGGYWRLPTSWYQAVEQQLILLNSSEDLPRAQQFVAWLLAPAQQEYIALTGYAIVE